MKYNLIIFSFTGDVQSPTPILHTLLDPLEGYVVDPIQATLNKPNELTMVCTWKERNTRTNPFQVTPNHYGFIGSALLGISNTGSGVIVPIKDFQGTRNIPRMEGVPLYKVL